MAPSFLARRARPRNTLSVQPRVDPLEERNLLSFAPAVPYPTGGGPVAVAVGDFTGNGILDLVTANQSSNSISILLGNGDGTFQQPLTYPAGVLPTAVAVGDFTGNGILDIVVVNQGHDPSNASVSIFLGNGDGTFQNTVNYVGLNALAFAVVVGDFNGDGNLDLGVADNGVTIFLGNGDGTFQKTATYGTGFGVAVGDVNNDGNLDLVTNTFGSSSVSVLLGNGDGTFQVANTYSFPGPVLSPVLADFNNDGNLDIGVVNRANNQVGVFLGNGDGSFQLPTMLDTGNIPQGLVAADFNGDGNADPAVVNNGEHTVGVSLGQGDGTFSAAGNFDTGGQFPIGLAVGDFNGDGYPDLVVANENSNTVGVLLNAADWGTRPGAPSTGKGSTYLRQTLGTALAETIRPSDFAPRTERPAAPVLTQPVPDVGKGADGSMSATIPGRLQAPTFGQHLAQPLWPDLVDDILARGDGLLD